LPKFNSKIISAVSLIVDTGLFISCKLTGAGTGPSLFIFGVFIQPVEPRITFNPKSFILLFMLTFDPGTQNDYIINGTIRTFKSIDLLE